MRIAETDRLLISKLTLDDASFLKELVNTPNWLKFIGDRNVKTLADSEKLITDHHFKNYEINGFGFYKLLLKSEENKVIGTCGLFKRDTLDDVDIGFAMLPDYEGKGFGYEASLAVMELAKNVFQLKKIVAITLAENINSIKLLEKLGLTYEKKVNPFSDDIELLLYAKDL